MKTFSILALLVIFFVKFSNAQSVLESDYVYEGKTIQYTIPKGFKHALYEDEPFVKLYLLDTTGFHEAAMDYFLDTVPFDKGIVCGYIDKVEYGYNLEFIVNNLQDVVDEEFGEFILFRQSPEYSIKNGLPFATVKCNYPDSEFEINEFKICVIEFGDFYFYFATLHAKRSDDKLMDYLFDKVTSSIKVIPTTKENTLVTWESVWNSLHNVGVNTEIDTDKIHFEKESSSYWESWTDQDYLLHYDYGAPDAQIQGTVRVLSAGIGSSEMTEEELVEFVSGSDMKYPLEDISFVENVQGTSVEFKKYSTKGPKDVLQLYTTELDGELLLIFAIRAAYTTGAFNKYYERFVTSMYISD